MIRVICLGKIKEDYLNLGINDYLKRINKYHRLEIIELKDRPDIKEEEKQILKYLNSHDFVIIMDINGDEIASEDMAEMLDKKLMEYGNITFVIGSSNGLSLNIKQKSHMQISFGKVTYPHGLFRVILLEQIYRSFKINNNESYHK